MHTWIKWMNDPACWQCSTEHCMRSIFFAIQPPPRISSTSSPITINVRRLQPVGIPQRKQCTGWGELCSPYLQASHGGSCAGTAKGGIYDPIQAWIGVRECLHNTWQWNKPAIDDRSCACKAIVSCMQMHRLNMQANGLNCSQDLQQCSWDCLFPVRALIPIEPAHFGGEKVHHRDHHKNASSRRARAAEVFRNPGDETNSDAEINARGC